MAEETVIDRFATYTSKDAQRNLQHVAQAVAILRAVRVAADAVDDGSMSYEVSDLSRWSPAVGAAVCRITSVMNDLVGKAGAPNVDWFTSHSLLEAFDAALWHMDSMSAEADRLDTADVLNLAQTVIDELGKLAQELASSLTMVKTEL